jgi:hypothetical protein
MLRVTLRIGGFGQLTSKTQAMREVGKEMGRRVSSKNAYSRRCASVDSHDDLALYGAGAVKDATVEEHYTCVRCGGVFARIFSGPPARQIWMLLNAGQH